MLVAASASPKVLYSALLSTSASAVVTAAASTSVKVSTGTACNTTGTAATFTLDVCKTGDTAGASHRVVSAASIAAGASLDLRPYLQGVMLGPGDFLSALSGTASAITLVITGAVHA